MIYYTLLLHRHHRTRHAVLLGRQQRQPVEGYIYIAPATSDWPRHIPGMSVESLHPGTAAPVSLPAKRRTQQPSAIVRVEGGNFTSHRPLHIGRHTFQRGASIHCTLLLHLYHHRRYAVLLGRQPRQPVREVHLLCIGHFRVAATRFSEERRFTTQCYGTCIITGDTQSS